MTELTSRSSLFSSKFAADLARSTVTALRESALSEWKSNAERFHDYDDCEAEGETSVDLLQPPVRRIFDEDLGRSPDGIVGPPAAESMTSAEIGQYLANGEDPYACTDMTVSPLWEVRPRAVAVLATILMCAMIEDEQTLGQVFRPGCVTLMLCPSSPMRSQIESVASEVLTHWQRKPLRPSKQAALHVYDSGSNLVAGEQGRSLQKFRQAIDKSLLRHAPIVAVCGAAQQLSSEQKSLVIRTLNWPGISPAAVVEALRWTHSNTAQVAEAELVNRLPDEDALRRMEVVQIAAAFEETTTLRVADRLAQIAGTQSGKAWITLKDVKGLEDAVRPLEQILADLKDWRKGRAAWSDVTRSALLFGPPGTGKTMLAHALAGSAGVPVITTSYADCQKHGHQGDMLAALSSAFEQAAQKAPSILFIDEIDSFSNRSTESSSHQYMRGIVNGLLEQINRAADVKGLILLGATNHLRDVDPAVVRDGRFDVKLEIPVPNRSGLAAILAAKLKLDANSTLDLHAIADRILGEPGATAEAIARDARGKARMERVAVAQRHLEAAADRIVPSVDPALLNRIALHEAGHILAALLSPLPTPTRAWVTPRGGGIEPAYLPTVTPELADAKLRLCLAGRAAEKLVLGQAANGAGIGPDSDLAQATRIALEMEFNWCFRSADLVWQNVNQLHFERLPREAQQRVRAHLQNADEAVSRLLKANLPSLKKVAAELICERELSQADLEALSKHLAPTTVSTTQSSKHSVTTSRS
ncbi:AAA family ATPase (plasmid) [Sulfitobacter faviae]|uniref:AAA family ATPase n=1 Tax=Sulfitobacter faviae TaxID=1775881 RepID=UPI002306FFF7|nr:AAA family ATPase [Sulfitobacter faviae]WCE68643.1 AAA family ATPase [Sulfitobacter faviae]